MERNENPAEVGFKSKSNVSKTFTIPMLFAEEWFEDCRLNYNNTYYLKMMSDHEFRKTFNSTAALIMQELVTLKEEVFELKSKIAELEAQKQVVSEPKSEKKTFG